MFLEAHCSLPLPFDGARVALERAVSDGGLVRESRRAFDEGMTYLMRVGPDAARVVRKQVLVRLLPARVVGSTLVVPLRWEATGPAARLFPALDANLGLTAAGDASLLSIIGRYDVPLGILGPALDQAVMAHAANSTAQRLLRDIADKVRSLAAPTNDRP